MGCNNYCNNYVWNLKSWILKHHKDGENLCECMASLFHFYTPIAVNILYNQWISTHEFSKLHHLTNISVEAANIHRNWPECSLLSSKCHFLSIQYWASYFCMLIEGLYPDWMWFQKYTKCIVGWRSCSPASEIQKNTTTALYWMNLYTVLPKYCT